MESRTGKYGTGAGILITIFALIFYFKSPLLSFVSYDMRVYVYQWYAQAKFLGLSYIKTTGSDYPPCYLYILWILTHVPVKKLLAVKTISIIFNFLTAVASFKIVSYKYKKKPFLAYAAYGIILFSPTVFLNSVMWGQCDSIIAFFSLAALYVLIKGQERKEAVLALVIYAVGISFKMQPIFILPVIILVLFERKISLFYLFIIPLVYFLTVIPALLAGKSFWDLICLPVRYYSLGSFGGSYTRMGMPNIYEWLPDKWPMLFKIGNVFCLTFVSTIALLIGKYRKKLILSGDMIIRLALLFSTLIPFLLPRIWHRYFFLADVISIIYAFYFPRLFYVPLLVNLASFITYGYWLGFINHVSFSQLTLLNLAALFVILVDLLFNLPKDTGNTQKSSP